MSCNDPTKSSNDPTKRCNVPIKSCNVPTKKLVVLHVLILGRFSHTPVTPPPCLGNLLHPKGEFSYQVNQSLKYIHRCLDLELAILVKTSTNNSRWKSVVHEYCAKPCLGCQFGSSGLLWQKIQEPLTLGANLLGVVEVNLRSLNTLCGLIE